MTHIELYISLNSSGDAFKCDIQQEEGHWKATLYQKDFEYTKIQEPTVWQCLESIAKKVDILGDVDSITGDIKPVYLATLKGHILLFKAKRGSTEEKYG